MSQPSTVPFSRHVPLVAFGALCLRLAACGGDGGSSTPGGAGAAGMTSGGNAGLGGTAAGTTGASAGTTGANGGTTAGKGGGTAGKGGATAGNGGATAGSAGTTAGSTAANGGSGGGGGPAAGNGGAAGCNPNLGLPPVTCVVQTGHIGYSTLDCDHAVNHELMCNGPCELLSTNSARCSFDSSIQTCVTSSDCATPNVCNGKDANLLTDPACVDGRCEWKKTTTVTCTLFCSGGSCQGVGGSTSGSFPTGQPATCSGDTIMFSFVQTAGGGGSGPIVASHMCQKACFTDTSGSGCEQVLGEAPFHTCENTPCPKTATMCKPGDPTHVTTFVQPTCGGGACDWLGTTVSECPAGTTCKVDSCVP